jgi:hypothetical protein
MKLEVFSRMFLFITMFDRIEYFYLLSYDSDFSTDIKF